jgi:hypothetical protein
LASQAGNRSSGEFLRRAQRLYQELLSLYSLEFGLLHFAVRLCRAVFALFAAVLLGLGTNPTFSDAAVRRYPLSSFQRLGARHLVGLLEPLWILVLALDLGLLIRR